VVNHGTPAKELSAGETALYYPENWVEVMGEFAAENGLERDIQYKAIPGNGISMLGLMPFSQAALHTE